MLNLTLVDWLILLIYSAVVLGVGFALKPHIKTSSDFLQAGRALPAWICGLAFIGVNVGAPEVVAMGASGAKYGLEVAQIYGIGAIPAMIFLAFFMMPSYYGSKARSVPEFVGMRFDHKTRALNACLFAAMTVLSAGIGLYAVARVVQALHIFDSFFYARGWPLEWIFGFSIVLTAVLVMAYILLGGLAGALYNQVLQFLLLVAGLLPLVLLGLKNAGGWSGLRTSMAAIDPRLMHEWKGVMHAGTNSMGLDIIGIGMGLGFVLGAGYWCTDFRVMQSAMAAKDIESAQRAPLIAAMARVFFPFLLVLPGLLALGSPTPHTTTVIREQNGIIFHETNVVSKEAEAGTGLVPAKLDAATGQPMVDASGHTLLDYDMATPNLLLHSFPIGLLGLGITALLASFMGGIASNVTAFNAVFTCDLYQAHIRKGADDGHYLAVGRWATVGGILLSGSAAFAVVHCNSILDALQLAFALVNAPLLATILLGMFWKRATGHGAFAGLLAGTAAALLHHGLTLPIAVHPGIHGGWIAVLHRYPSDIAQNIFTALCAFSANLIVTVLVSLFTKPHSEAELAELVHSLTPKRPMNKSWWKRPETLAVGIFLAAIALNIFFF